jgi:hypothetical protein
MKRRKCKCCGEKWMPEEGTSLWMNWCSLECHTELALKQLAKIREARERARVRAQIRQERIAREEKAKPRKDLIAFRLKDRRVQFRLTREAAQKLGNRLDAHLKCISCDKPRGSSLFCGGHYKTAGGHGEKALLIANIHGQCNKDCNSAKSGNINGDKNSKGFTQGLIDRYGKGFVDYLTAYALDPQYTCEELIEMRKEFNAEIRRLEKGLPPSKNWRDIPRECPIAIQ